MINPFVRRIVLLGEPEITDAIEYVYKELFIIKKTELVDEAVKFVSKDKDNLIICCSLECEEIYGKLRKYNMRIGYEYIGIRRLIDWIDIFRISCLSQVMQRNIAENGLVCWGNEEETKEFEYVNNLKNISRIDTENKNDVVKCKSFIVITSWNYWDMVQFLESCEKKEGKDFIYYKEIRSGILQSQMFWNVICDKKKYGYICDAPFDYSQIEAGGNIKFCCLGLKTSSGNLNELNFRGIWDSMRARIIRLSVLTGKYTFCDSSVCPFLCKMKGYKYEGISTQMDERQYPSMINISLDHTCNLYCEHCREKVLTANHEEQNDINHLITIVISEIMPHVNRVLLAGNGEVFFSKSYRKIIENEELGREDLELAILSNGTLFTEDNFKKIKMKHKSIGVSISVDACTKQTYEAVRRGGDFNKLYNNLTYISSLRKKGEIAHFQLNFVVRADNVFEMGDFVDFAKELNVDLVRFSKLENWIFSENEFETRNVFIGNEIKKEYIEFFEDKRLFDPVVDLRNIRKYIGNKSSLVE